MERATNDSRLFHFVLVFAGCARLGLMPALHGDEETPLLATEGTGGGSPQAE